MEFGSAVARFRAEFIRHSFSSGGLHPESECEKMPNGHFFAERPGFEPGQHLRVDRLAICSITTLAPLQKYP